MTTSAPSATTWRINSLLVGLGAIAGAIAAIPLTYLGKVIAGAPAQATLSNYAWNMAAFAIMGALFCPLLTWSALRRVPLWRAMGEPALGGLIGSVAGFLLGSGVGFIGLAAIGIAAATWRLSFAYRDRAGLPT